MPLGSPAKWRRPLPGIIARLCTGLTVLFVSVSAATPAGATELYVYATSLTLRAAADTSAPRTARLSFGDSARQIEAGPHAQIGTVTGQWLKLEADGRTGYAFDAYLLPVPVPDIEAPGIASLLARLAPAGGPQTATGEDGTRITSQAYSHGITHRTLAYPMGDGGFFEAEQVHAANLTVFQGYLLARAIVAQDGLTSHVLATTAPVATDSNGDPFIFDESNWQMIDVHPHGNGVLISYPERAD